MKLSSKKSLLLNNIKAFKTYLVSGKWFNNIVLVKIKCFTRAIFCECGQYESKREHKYLVPLSFSGLILLYFQNLECTGQPSRVLAMMAIRLVREHWHSLAKNIGGQPTFWESKNGWNHRHFSIIGGHMPRLPPKSMLMSGSAVHFWYCVSPETLFLEAMGYTSKFKSNN